MSKFLGFIHYIMFDKINFQEEINNSILEIAIAEGHTNIVEKVNSVGIIEEGKLEDIIDESNIHGWLQERVNIVEKRFATATSLLLKKNPGFENKIYNLLFELGVKENFNGSPKEAFDLISFKFLDGMPCDRAIGIVEETEDSIVFEVFKDLHSQFWERYNLKNIYWNLRNAFINGVLEKTEYGIYKLEENKYIIRR